MHCPRCNVSFDAEKLSKCIYCDGALFERDIFKRKATEKIVIQDREVLTHERKSYLLGVFFRRRTFLTSFLFSLNDMKSGQSRKRFWIQPMSMSGFIKLPWFLINFFCSIIFYFSYQGYCKVCDMKYVPISGEGHCKDDCEYNQEYNQIVQSLFCGKIFIGLKSLEEAALERTNHGKRSAYFDLMRGNVLVEKFLDILSIWITMAFYIYLIVIIVMPIFGKIYRF
ncbi:MAG: hypothetical protein P9M07_02270 [Candidatus Aceula meridiana]|nr:hypothetical protein [Candidatus Aceula meridiana]